MQLGCLVGFEEDEERQIKTDTQIVGGEFVLNPFPCTTRGLSKLIPQDLILTQDGVEILYQPYHTRTKLGVWVYTSNTPAQFNCRWSSHSQ